LAPNSPVRKRAVPNTSSQCSSEVEKVKPVAKRADKSKDKPGDNEPSQGLSQQGSETSRYIDWATLMRRTFGIDVLECPKCQSTMKVLAVISQPEVVEKILVHVKLPVTADVLADGCTPAFDVTDQTIPALPVPDSVVGTNPEDSNPEHHPHGYERGPPCFDGVDPPWPDDCPVFDA